MLKSYCQGKVFGEHYRNNPSEFSEVIQAICLHGWQRTHKDFAKLAEFGNLSLLALDLPGFGQSPAPPIGWSTQDYAMLVNEVIDEVGGPLIVIGHSFGGRVAVRLADHYPQQVRGLILSGVPLLQNRNSSRVAGPKLGYRMIRSLNRHGVIGEERMEKARRKYGSLDYRNSTGVMREVLVKAVNESYDDSLGRIKCPVRLLWSDNDMEAPFELAIELTRRFPSWKLTTISGAGHLIPSGSPDALSQELVALLEQS